MSNYRIAYDKGFQDLSERSPHEIAVFLHVRYDSTAESFLVPYFGEDYKVDCKAKTVTKCSDGSEPPIDDAILILHYLTFAELHQTYAPLGKWVSLKEIPNGGSLFYPAFHKDSILGLIHAFGNCPDQFEAVAKKLCGTPAAMGDVSAEFLAFPLIPLCAAIWEGDDEFAPNATILYDPLISALLHIESIIGLGMRLAKKLIEQKADSCD